MSHSREYGITNPAQRGPPRTPGKATDMLSAEQASK